MLDSTSIAVWCRPPGLCICVSSYSVNRLLNLLALQVDDEGLCGSASDGSCWTKDTLEAQHMRGRTQKTTKKAKNSQRLLLRFRLNRKLCIFLCTKCTDAMHSSFLCAVFSSLLSNSLTTHKHSREFCTKQKKPFCFVFYRLCAPLNGLLLYHSWKCWMGSKKKFWVEEIQAKSWLRVSLERAYVCADYINLCNLQCNYCSEDKKMFSRGNQYRLKKAFFKHDWSSSAVCSLETRTHRFFSDSAAATVRQEVVVSPGCFCWKRVRYNVWWRMDAATRLILTDFETKIDAKLCVWLGCRFSMHRPRRLRGRPRDSDISIFEPADLIFGPPLEARVTNAPRNALWCQKCRPDHKLSRPLGKILTKSRSYGERSVGASCFH